MYDIFFFCHPAVSLMFFLLITVVSIIFLNPIMLAISFFAAFTYALWLNGKKALKLLLMSIPIVLLWTIFNLFTNHEGVSPFLYINGHAITIESAAYGFATGMMFVAVLTWFSCFNKVITSDKLFYVFGRFLPAVTLLLTMVLRFIPRYTVQISRISDARRGIGQGTDSGSVLARARSGAGILRSLTQWSFENAIDTADSMNARGFGTARRTQFSQYGFKRRDIRTALLIGALFLCIVIGLASGASKSMYFPRIVFPQTTPLIICFYVVFTAFSFFPVMINIWEVLRWRFSLSRI